jgi:hypothetical protein
MYPAGAASFFRHDPAIAPGLFIFIGDYFNDGRGNAQVRQLQARFYSGSQA